MKISAQHMNDKIIEQLAVTLRPQRNWRNGLVVYKRHF